MLVFILVEGFVIVLVINLIINLIGVWLGLGEELLYYDFNNFVIFLDLSKLKVIRLVLNILVFFVGKVKRVFNFFGLWKLLVKF